MSSLINPDLYHGKYKTSNFFEGWYFKLITEDNSRSIAFIPGISFCKTKRENHSFIQILDGNKRSFNYIKYPTSEFSTTNTPFKINIGPNSFSLSEINLNIYNHSINLNSNIIIDNIKKWDDSIINPGSMGFYNYIPFMECYSQVCALNGDLYGTLFINNEIINLDNGKIYIEKNWGSSFPLEWIWVQCNSFNDKRATLTCSLGRVPFFLKSFQGFLIAVTIDNKIFKFTTINRSTLNLSLHNGIEITAINKNIKLFLKTTSYHDEFILCYGPKNGSMVPYVKESIISNVYMKLENMKTHHIVYEGFGVNTGIEYGGNFLKIEN